MAFANWFMVMVGAGAISVPILLHLLLRPQPRQIVFPAVRFLQARQKTNQRELKWRHWLLLFLRGAILFVLALAFARPHIPSAAASAWAAFTLGLAVTTTLAVCWVLAISRRLPAGLTRSLAAATAAGLLFNLFGLFQIVRHGAAQAGFGTQQAPVAAAWVVDTSPRMLYRHRGATRLERADELVKDLLSDFPAQSEFVVIDRPDAASAFTQDANGVLKQIQSLTVTGRSQPLQDTARRALQVLRTSQLKQRELYLMTDLTAAAWESGDRDGLLADLKQNPDVRVHVIDCGVVDPENNSVLGLTPNRERTSANGEVELTATVRRLGGPATCRVEWLLEQPDPSRPYVQDGKLQLPQADVRSQATLTFDGPGEQEVSWTATGLTPGVHHGRVRIIPSDALPIDDEAYFTLEAQGGWRVAVVTGAKTVSQFLTAALSDPSDAQAATPRYVTSVYAQDGNLPNDWSTYSVVVLLDPAPPTEAQWAAWTEYVQQGGRLMIFLGRNARADQFNSAAAQKLMPAPLGRLWRTEGVYLQPSRDAHPSQQLFQRQPTTWENMPIFRHWSFSHRPADVVIPWWFTNGQPAMVEKSVGRGKVVVMMTPISDAASDPETWNLLPTGLENWPFVVMIDQWFTYLVQQDSAPLNYRVGEPASVAVTATDQPVRYQLFTPRGEWREVAARGTQVDVALTDQPGTYRLRSTDPAIPPQGFSVNLADEAGDLKRYDTAQLDAWLKTTGAHLADQQGKLERTVSEARVGVDLLAYLLVVLAILLLLEGTLAARFYPGATAPVAAAGSAGSAAREMADVVRGATPAEVITAEPSRG
ncbi:MAG: BatA domain-containing protein [Pirellulales bacterium]